MKKLFLLIAFTGIVGASSALSVASLSKATVINAGGEEKKDEKKKCDKDKACCKKDAGAKACSGAGEPKAETKACSGEMKGKSCCKGKTTAAASPSTVPSSTTVEAK
ncbi:MAG: hypothetical protein V4608_08670 [Bacteroidota bacterium]